MPSIIKNRESIKLKLAKNYVRLEVRMLLKEKTF